MESGSPNNIVDIKKYNDLLRKYHILEEENTKYKTLIKESVDGIIILDNYGRIKEINDIALKFNDSKKEEIIGKNFLQLPIKFNLSTSAMLKLFQDSIKDKKIITRLDIINSKDKHINLECSTSLIKKGKKTLGLLVIAKNINAEITANKTAKDSQSLYKTIVDNSHDAIYIYQKDGFLFVNNKLCELSGFAEEELINNSIWQLIHDDDRKRLQEYALKRMKGFKVPDHYIAKVVCKNGDIKHCNFSVCTINFKGKFAVLGQVRDVSHEIEAQQSIKDELNRLDIIFNSVDAYVYVSDMDTHEILFVNDNIKKDIGSDFLNKKCWSFFHNDKNGQCEFCNNEKLIDKKRRIRKPIKWEFYNEKLQKWFYIKDQAIKWPDGRILRLEVATDITERKVLMESITESNRKFKSIFDNTPLGIMYYDNKGVIVDYNNNFVSLIGSSKEILIGFNMMKQIKDKELKKQMQISLKDGVGYYEGNYESVTTKKTTPVRILFKGIENDKKEIYAGVCLVEDISESIKSRDELIASHQTFKNIYDNAITAIYILDLDGHFIDVNDGALKMYGYTKKEIISKSPKFLADKSKNDFDKFKKLFVKVINGHSQNTEFWGKRKNGESFPKLIRLTKGKYFGKDCVLVFAVDITNIKKAESLLRKSEEKYRIITETADDLISTISIEDSPKFIYVSPSHYRKLGYKPKDLIGKSITDIIHPEDHLKIISLIQEKLSVESSSNDKKLDKNSLTHTLQIKLLTKKRKWREMETSASLQDDKIILISRDITERIETESVRSLNIWLLESLAQTDIALRSNINMNISINNVLKVVKERYNCCGAFLAHIDDSFKQCDIKFESIIRKKCTELAFKSIDSFAIKKIVSSKKPVSFYSLNGNIINKSVKSKKLNSMLFISIKPHEGNPWLFGICDHNNNREWNDYENKLLVELGNRLTDTINIMHYLKSNVESKKEIEQKSIQIIETNKNLKKALKKAEESDKLKSLFLANMSHEIRTPMNSIVGFSDLMQKSFTSNIERIEYAGIIHTSSKTLLALISDIVDLSKIEAGELKMFYQNYNLNSIIHDLYNQNNIISKKGLNEEVSLFYKTEFDDNNCIINTDEVRLKQILNNLIANAIKFTKRGQIEIGYELEDQKTIRFFVRDTGIGIKKEDIKYIFKRFGQAMSTNKAIFGGAGLGLSISQGLVRLFGGKFWVESEYGKGTVFYFTYPLKKPMKKESTNMKTTLTIDNPDWKNNTMLVVDDNPATIQYFKAVLKPTKAKLLIAINGENAIDIVKNHRLDIVLMDIMLPGISGLQATSVIKKLKPDLPIIAQTAYALSGDREKALKGGCNDYISKPINRDELIKVINKYIK